MRYFHEISAKMRESVNSRNFSRTSCFQTKAIRVFQKCSLALTNFSGKRCDTDSI